MAQDEKVVYSGPALTIRDVRCRPDCAECGPEEFNDRNSIVFIRRGAFVRKTSRGEAFGDSSRVLFFSRGEPYRVYHPVEGGDDCTSLAFSMNVLCDALHNLNADRNETGGLFPVSDAPLDSRTLGVLHQLRRWARSERADSLAIEELSLRLLDDVFSRIEPLRPPRLRARADTTAVHAALVMNTKSFLGSAFREPLLLSQIARAVHSSPFHLARIFARQTGCSIHRYRVRLRLAAALDALSDGAENLTMLALDLGFSSHSHFSYAFRREFGMVPSEAAFLHAPSGLREMSKNLKARPPISV